MMTHFSVVMPVHDPPLDLLREAVESVFGQTHEHWDLCITDDGSSRSEIRAYLDDLARDRRVRLTRHETAQGISAATNAALALGEGSFVAFLDHDDLLHPDALAEVAFALDRAGADVEMIYTDEDLIDVSGRRHSPFFKPPWSPERFRTQMYLRHLLVLRRDAIEAVGGLRSEVDGSQDWDIAWRVAERGGEVLHVPKILYHWREAEGSAAADPEAKRWAFDAGTKVLQDHCDRIGVPADVEQDEELRGVYHLRPALTHAPLVSIIVPTKGSRRLFGRSDEVLVERLARGLADGTSYGNWELLLVVDDNTPTAVVERVGAIVGDRLRIIRATGPFNYSERNNQAALAAEGEFLLLLNDDVEPLTPDWLDCMLVHALTPGVGAVGARLQYPDGRFQHVGAFLSPSGPTHLYHGMPGKHLGYVVFTRIANNLEAVTGACLLTARSTFAAAGGLSPRLPLNYNDVDYCQKVRLLGRRIVCCPDARLVHHESATRPSGFEKWELDEFRDRWHRTTPDHYRNPNLVSGELPPYEITVYSKWWQSSRGYSNA